MKLMIMTSKKQRVSCNMELLALMSTILNKGVTHDLVTKEQLQRLYKKEVNSYCMMLLSESPFI
ncbi:CLUMA_CG003721, isoform A [Clunio marinus]|uniref:CLUMA_CG003721, isoform A n=1 Tax=Clunio marinus TaxID=568069 RepID=A0A1J1HPV3_9DIPT|nr:CLUMA_CG003721, isoform A [Clunio marinus]